MKNDKAYLFGASSLLQVGNEYYTFYIIKTMEQHALCAPLPFSVRILLENLLRQMLTINPAFTGTYSASRESSILLTGE